MLTVGLRESAAIAGLGRVVPRLRLAVAARRGRLLLAARGAALSAEVHAGGDGYDEQARRLPK